MQARHLIHLLVVMLVAVSCGWGQETFQSISLCELQQDAERFLNVDVEVSALMIVGGHRGHLKEGACLFGFAFGDDYQTFGDRFAVKHDSQWDLMKKILNRPICKNISSRVMNARFRGTVVREPATGTIPEDEMRLELIVRGVSEVSRVPIKCPPQ